MTCLGASTETDTGIQVTASGAPPHPRPYCRGRVWRSFDTDLESRVFEAPFASLLAYLIHYYKQAFKQVEAISMVCLSKYCVE